MTAAALVILLSGCGISVNPPPDPPPPNNTDIVDGNVDPSLTSPVGKTSGEPNDFFSQAVVAVFDNQGIARLQGTVAMAGDLDVYFLGAFQPGDRLFVDTFTTGSPLDISIAVFDDQDRLVYANDDRGGSASRFLDSLMDWTVRHGGSSYHLVITHSAFAAEGTFTGTYTVNIQVDRGGTAPLPVPQVIVLDFDGAVVDSPSLGSMTIAPFDAADISPTYRGETQTIKDTIRAVFEQNFERYAVTILTTDDSPLPDESTVSTIYFGGINSQAFGLAEDVDLYNSDFCDDAIIFTESFSTRVFSFVPTPVELATAIGNVGSHEAGHLLGLNHVDDDRALMDDQSAADVFMDDQEFMEAPLSSDIMRIGTQDADLLLGEIVGPSSGASQKRRMEIERSANGAVQGWKRPLPSPLASKRRTSRLSP